MPSVTLLNPIYGAQTWAGATNQYFLLGKDSYIISSGTTLDATTVGNNRVILIEGSMTSNVGNGVRFGDLVGSPTASLNNAFTVGKEGSIQAGADAVIITAQHTRVTNYGEVDSIFGNAFDVRGNSTSFNNFGAISTGAITAIFLNGNNVTFRNSGEILSDSTGLSLTGDSAVIHNNGLLSTFGSGISVSGDFAKIRNSGVIQSESGVFANGNGSKLLNTGDISATFDGVIYFDVGFIENSGKIVGGDEGISYTQAATRIGDLRIKNSGLIQGGDHAIEVTNSGGPAAFGRLVLNNSGEILGDIDAATPTFNLQGHRIINTGEIQGDISFGAANDFYNGTRGQVVGTVYGNSGEDTLIGGSEGNTLDGGAGDDTLYGRGGDDTLIGLAGDDTLIGGAHDDVFIFGVHDGHDVITDFTNGQDKIDLSAFGLNPSDYASVVAPALSAHGAGSTFLDLTEMGGTGTIVINGLTLAQAGASDFIF